MYTVTAIFEIQGDFGSESTFHRVRYETGTIPDAIESIHEADTWLEGVDKAPLMEELCTDTIMDWKIAHYKESTVTEPSMKLVVRKTKAQINTERLRAAENELRKQILLTPPENIELADTRLQVLGNVYDVEMFVRTAQRGFNGQNKSNWIIDGNGNIICSKTENDSSNKYISYSQGSGELVVAHGATLLKFDVRKFLAHQIDNNDYDEFRY